MPMILPHMVRHGEQCHVTEEYVSVPPALTIADETGAIWTLGLRLGAAPRGEFAFNVLRNGVEMGEVASRIERTRGRIRIFTAQGWKILKTVRNESVYVYGIGARLITGDESTTRGSPPIWITIYRDDAPTPLVHLAVDPAEGSVHDMSYDPLICAPGRWLVASIDTAGVSVEVAALLNRRNLRMIPVVSHTIKE